ncbi:MAG: hypothetical protein R3E79_59070 [Caldilineaceae bacterium]
MTEPLANAPTTDILKDILGALLTLPAEELAAVQAYVHFLQSNPKGLPQANGNEMIDGQLLTGYDILLTKQENNGYIARPVLLPDIVVSGATEDEALAQVRQAIAQQQRQSRIVRVHVSAPNETADDPWLRFAGMWEDDPNWEQFLADIAANRKLIDAQTQPDLVSE